jgi:hypothetical protein
MARYGEPSRRLSEQGRELLAAAVAIDWDWALPASSYDKLAEALAAMSKDDLEAAHLLTYHLQEAVAVLLMQRDGEERREAQRET